MKDLAWGYNGPETRALPEHTMRWGARTILEHGYLDIVADRTSHIEHSNNMDYPQEELLLKPLRDNMPKIREAVQRLWDSGRLGAGSAAIFVVFENDVLKVVGSACKSFGYFYLTAWLKGVSPDFCIEFLNQKSTANAVALCGDFETWCSALTRAMVTCDNSPVTRGF